MRIISNFHDYYDQGQAYGQDSDIIYFRKTVVRYDHYGNPFLVNSHGYNPLQYSNYVRCNYCIYIEPILVGFAGKTYNYIRLTKDFVGQERLSVYAHVISHVDAFMEKCLNSYGVDLYYNNRRGKKRKGYSWRLDRENFELVFTTHNKWDKYFNGKDPIFVIQKKVGDNFTFTDNPCLKEIEFYRVLDPYTSWQELFMFMGSLAKPDRPIPAINDEIMAQAKGFDKWSFRKEPKPK